MELDKRIKEGKRPLNCFDTEQAEEFIGKKCYFSDDARDFINLDKADDDTLFYVAELQNIWTAEEYCFADNSNAYRFILPCEWVKPEESKEPEKKYRPLSLNEFLNRYRLGNTVYFRRIGYKEVKCAMFVEYVRGESPEENQIVLGNMRYTLAYLFKNHELSLEDIWQPFGVIDE